MSAASAQDAPERSRRASPSTLDRNFGDGQIFLSGCGGERDCSSHVFFRERGKVLEDLSDGGALGQAGQNRIKRHACALEHSLAADDLRISDDQLVVVHRSTSILADYRAGIATILPALPSIIALNRCAQRSSAWRFSAS